MEPRSTPHRRLRRGRLLVVAPVAATAFLLAAAVAPAGATPGTEATTIAEPTTAAEAAVAVSDTAHQLEVVSEQINDAELALAGQQATAAAAAGAADLADVAVAALQPQVDAIVRSRFLDGLPSGLQTVLDSGSAEEMLDRVSTISQLTDHTEAVLAQLAAAQRSAADARATADAAAAAAAAALADIQARQDDLATQLAGFEADVARLTAPARASVATSLAGPELSADSTDEAAAAAPAAAPSEAAAVAVQIALAQRGDPYVFGAAGPDAFDCSGLTQYAYAAAGISLPHSSRAQSGMGVAVARGDLQPGDLVFFYSPVSHVGMYIGNGQMVHASVGGRPVVVASVDMRGYVGARRIT